MSKRGRFEMMKVNVNGNIRTWELVGANGQEYICDFIGNNGGWDDITDNGDGTFSADQESVDYWEKCINIQRDIDAFMQQIKEHLEFEEISNALRDTDDSDFDLHLSNIRSALLELAEEKNISIE